MSLRGLFFCRHGFFCVLHFKAVLLSYFKLSGLLNANAKSQRFSYAISQIATLPPVAGLNRNSEFIKSQRDTLRFWHAIPQTASSRRKRH